MSPGHSKAVERELTTIRQRLPHMFGLETKELLIYGGAGVGGLLVLVLIIKMLSGGQKKQHKDLEKGQRETLDDYPDPPPAPEGRRLVFDGVDVRLRLVAMAPTGKQHDAINVDEVQDILNDLLRGFGNFVKSDKPRIRIWPPQLSLPGFAPSFFRLVESPDDQGKKSHWIRAAGPIKIGGKPYLLGLALFAEEANKLGAVNLAATEWVKHLQIEK
jgi:hypothetical protein